MTDDLTVRRIRIAPGVRDAVIREMTSRPESPHAAQRRARREYAEIMADYEEHPERYAHALPVENCPIQHARLTPTRPCGVCGYVTGTGEL